MPDPFPSALRNDAGQSERQALTAPIFNLKKNSSWPGRSPAMTRVFLRCKQTLALKNMLPCGGRRAMVEAKR
jgi:hypothetical protein